jgi:hypothetical protein
MTCETTRGIEMERISRRIVIVVGVFAIRWAIKIFGAMWPRAYLSMAFDSFKILDTYYGHPIDIEDRIDLLINKLSEGEKLKLYQQVVDAIEH